MGLAQRTRRVYRNEGAARSSGGLARVVWKLFSPTYVGGCLLFVLRARVLGVASAYSVGFRGRVVGVGLLACCVVWLLCGRGWV